MTSGEDEITRLRHENDMGIQAGRYFNLDWERLKKLVNIRTTKADREGKKISLQPKNRLYFEKRDMGKCYVCGSVFHYGSCNVYSGNAHSYKQSHLHHIMPNGGIDDSNIVTLCTHCHQIVHQAMYVSGTWKYARPL